MAEVVLTLGRWCSRGRLEGRRWRGEGVLGDVDVHGGVDVPAPGPAPPPAQTASSPLLVMAVADSSLGVSAALRCAAFLLGSTRACARAGPSACGPAGRGVCPIPRARPRSGSPCAARI
jgi:hypothetical protein